MFEELDALTTAALKKVAQEEGVLRYSKLKKDDLVHIIKTHRVNAMVADGMSRLLAIKQ